MMLRRTLDNSPRPSITHYHSQKWFVQASNRASSPLNLNYKIKFYIKRKILLWFFENMQLSPSPFVQASSRASGGGDERQQVGHQDRRPPCSCPGQHHTAVIIIIIIINIIIIYIIIILTVIVIIIKIVTKMIVIIVIVNQELEELRQKLEKKQVYLVNTANIVLL